MQTFRRLSLASRVLTLHHRRHQGQHYHRHHLTTILMMMRLGLVMAMEVEETILMMMMVMAAVEGVDHRALTMELWTTHLQKYLAAMDMAVSAMMARRPPLLLGWVGPH